ncbi:unnamed protein product [Oncorhynchus mykiss]|uniref:Uncharacterized protein n=1 Tax=Oncorhynchus mykiss TaxID=8022 RepID=A0A060ZGX5_ONCMY|nr:unnamed protein product [Oncorhynchus mykiss]
MAAGVSMGGMMLANYLGRKGRETCLKGVVVFSAGWDVFECTASLEKPLDRFLFNSYLTSCLQAGVDRHKSVLEKSYDIDHVMKVKCTTFLMTSSNTIKVKATHLECSTNLVPLRSVTCLISQNVYTLS